MGAPTARIGAVSLHPQDGPGCPVARLQSEAHELAVRAASAVSVRLAPNDECAPGRGASSYLGTNSVYLTERGG